MITFLKKLIGDMAKYKYISKSKSFFFTEGVIYDEEYKTFDSALVKECVRRNPNNWQLIEDNYDTVIELAFPSKISKENDFVLPKKWYIEVTHENSDIIYKWRKKEGFFNPPRLSGSYMNEEGFLSIYPPAGTRISFNEFKKYVLGMENKKIIGYKLIKPEYKKPALTISKAVGHWENKLKEYDIHISQSRYLERLTSAGVLDLWFEPVYEEEFKVGDWVVVLPEDRWYSNSDQGKAQKIYAIKKGDILPYKLESSSGWTNAYEKIRKATPEEIAAVQYKLPVINGYEGEDLKDGKVAYGCKVVFVKTLKELYSLGVSTIVINEFKVTRGDIKQILKYFDNKLG